MSSNSLGKLFTFTTWGESHGEAIGCVVDGVPSKISLKEEDWELAGEWMWTNRDCYNGLSVLPHDGGTYIQAPFEDISKEKFEEMETLGWIGSDRPRMIAIQAEGCAPIVRAFENGAESAEPWEGAETVASGIVVPRLTMVAPITIVGRPDRAESITAWSIKTSALFPRPAGQPAKIRPRRP